MDALETQEAGTGKWFPIIIYTPGTEQQLDDAIRTAQTFHALGLHARVVGFKPEGLTS